MVTVVGSGVASDVTGAASVVAAVVSNSPFPDGPEKGASGVSCASHSKPPTVFLQTKIIPSISGQAVSWFMLNKPFAHSSISLQTPLTSDSKKPALHTQEPSKMSHSEFSWHSTFRHFGISWQPVSVLSKPASQRQTYAPIVLLQWLFGVETVQSSVMSAHSSISTQFPVVSSENPRRQSQVKPLSELSVQPMLAPHGLSAQIQSV